MRHFLIVVDMQKDFVDGALGTKEAQAIIPAAAGRRSNASPAPSLPPSIPMSPTTSPPVRGGICL